MAITAISRDWGQDPSLVRVVSSDTLAACVAAAYITGQADNIDALNHGAFKWKDSDKVLLEASDGSALLKIKSDYTALEAFLDENSNASGVGLKYAGKEADGGGSATIAITVTGLLATDIVMAQVEASTNAVEVQKVTPTANTLTVLLSGDPGAATVIAWQALRPV